MTPNTMEKKNRLKIQYANNVACCLLLQSQWEWMRWMYSSVLMVMFLILFHLDLRYGPQHKWKCPALNTIFSAFEFISRCHCAVIKRTQHAGWTQNHKCQTDLLSHTHHSHFIAAFEQSLSFISQFFHTFSCQINSFGYFIYRSANSYN